MPRQSETDNSGRIVLIIVGSVVGAFLLVGLACGGFFFLTTYVFVKSAERVIDKASDEMEKMRQSLEAQNAADVFLGDLPDRAPQAYENTTRAYQGRRTLEQFRASLDEHPLLKQRGNFPQPMGPLPPVVNDRVTLRIVLNGNQATSLTLNMQKEDGRWKVDDFTVP